MENFGYILSEAPLFVLIVWFTVRFIRWRRSRENRPGFSDSDKHVLFHAGQHAPKQRQFYLRFLVTVFAVTALGSLLMVVLAPFGAAILAGVLVLTSAAVVHEIMLSDR
jgi:hypothetical protein